MSEISVRTLLSERKTPKHADSNWNDTISPAKFFQTTVNITTLKTFMGQKEVQLKFHNYFIICDHIKGCKMTKLVSSESVAYLILLKNVE